MGSITEAYLKARGHLDAPPDDYICIKEAVARFRISDNAVYRLISKNAVRVRYMGRTPLVHLEDIEVEAARYLDRVSRRRQAHVDPSLSLDAFEREYPRGLTNEQAIAAYYREKDARVLQDARAVRRLADGRIAIDAGFLFG